MKVLKDRGIMVNYKIIGSTRDEDYLKKLNQSIAQLGLETQVDIMGMLKGTQAVIDQYNSSDLGLFVSLEETFGLVPLEMLASGLPLISTKVGILEDKYQEFKDAGVAYIDVTDINHIADQIELAMRGDIKVIKHEILSQFTTSGIVSQFEQLYKKMLSDV